MALKKMIDADRICANRLFLRRVRHRRLCFVVIGQSVGSPVLYTQRIEPSPQNREAPEVLTSGASLSLSSGKVTLAGRSPGHLSLLLD